MTEYKIPAANWRDVLAVTLKDAQPGDVVVVRTEPMLRMAEIAAERMGKTGIKLIIAGVLDDRWKY